MNKKNVRYQLLEINARNALAHRAEQIGRHRSDAPGDDVGGTNVLAVYCKQDRGGQFIDAGLVVLK